MKRGRQEKNDLYYVPLAPSYELRLSNNEPPSSDGTMSVVVEEGQAITLRCTAGEGIETETLIFERGNHNIEGNRTRESVTQFIPSFKYASHSGLYHCSAQSSTGEYHSRRMRLSTKATVNIISEPCPPEDDFCGTYGTCNMELGNRFCICNGGYMGKNCENLLVQDYLSTSALFITTVKVVAGAGGTLNVVFIFLTLMFAWLFMKERKKVRIMVNHYGPLPVLDSLYGDDPENPYEENCYIEKSDSSLKIAHETEQPALNQQQSSIQKFRKAIRVRLPGISDPELLDGTGS